MPPKRKSDGDAASTTKKSKAANPVPEEDQSLRHPRWAEVSASGNSDAAYRLLLRDPEYAYAWLTASKRLFENRAFKDEDDEDEDEEEVSFANGWQQITMLMACS